MKKITVMGWLGSAIVILFLILLFVNYLDMSFNVALYDDYMIHDRSNPFILWKFFLILAGLILGSALTWRLNHLEENTQKKEDSSKPE